MHESYVSLEIAKLLKKLGFKWGCRAAWDLTFPNEPYLNHVAVYPTYFNNDVDDILYAPTLAVAQRWLREVKRCIVEVNYDDCQKHYWVELFINEDDGGGIPFYGNVFAMFEEAQEAGIKKCLTLLLKEE